MSMFATTMRRPHRGSLPALPAQAKDRAARSRSFHADTSALDVDAQLVLAQIQQLTLDVSTARGPAGSADVRYVLRARHARAGVEWTLSRPFDDFRALQRRLRAALRPGHVCVAGGCPWLENVLVNYFPARNPLFFLRDSFPALVRRRREALASAMRAVQAFLAAHSNHTCAVVTQSVAPEFLRFVCGDDMDANGSDPAGAAERAKVREGLRLDAVRALVVDGRACTEADFSTPALTTSSCRELRVASCSSASTAEMSADSSEASESSGAGGICELCSQSMPASNAYVTQLLCGHRFHDECVLPKLNEALQCPLCGRDDRDGQRRESKSSLTSRQPRPRPSLRDVASV